MLGGQANRGRIHCMRLMSHLFWDFIIVLIAGLEQVVHLYPNIVSGCRFLGCHQAQVRHIMCMDFSLDIL